MGALTSICCKPELQGLYEEVVGQDKLPHPALCLPNRGRFVTEKSAPKRTVIKIASSNTGGQMVFRLSTGAVLFKVLETKESRSLFSVMDLDTKEDIGSVEMCQFDLQSRDSYLNSQPSVTLRFGTYTFEVTKCGGLKGDYVSDAYKLLWNKVLIYEASADASTEEFVLREALKGNGEIIAKATSKHKIQCGYGVDVILVSLFRASLKLFADDEWLRCAVLLGEVDIKDGQILCDEL